MIGSAKIRRAETGRAKIGKAKERWIQLCEQAASEQDTTKLLTLVEEVVILLAAQEQRLNQRGTNSVPQK